MTVIDQRSGRALGTCAFMRIDRANGVVELGMINWSPRMQRQASGSEAIFLMLRHVFDDLGYRRCEWKCDQLNAPSRAAALRFGFSLKAPSARPWWLRGATGIPTGCQCWTMSGRSVVLPLTPGSLPATLTMMAGKGSGCRRLPRGMQTILL